MKTIVNRNVGLDLVRAIAILLIMCSHSVILVAPNSTETLPFIIKFFGTIGVDVFFVLSGFLIGSILLKQIKAHKTKPKDFVYFWIRRWFRTLPNYYLLLVVNIALVYIFNRIDDFSILKYSFFFQNFNTAQADFFTESWSLTIEEFAYIILPLGLLILSVLNRKITQRLFLILTIIVIIFSVLNRVYFHFYIAENIITSNWSHSLRKVLIYRLDSIYYGFIAAFIYLNNKRIWHYKFSLFIIGVSLFIVMHLVLFFIGIQPNLESQFFNVWYLTLLPISIMFTFPLVMTFQLPKILKNIVTKMSLWSYSLYLINYSVVLLTLREFIKIETLTITSKVVLITVFWSISIFLSALLYRYFETPITRLRDSNRVKRFL